MSFRTAISALLITALACFAISCSGSDSSSLDAVPLPQIGANGEFVVPGDLADEYAEIAASENPYDIPDGESHRRAQAYFFVSQNVWSTTRSVEIFILDTHEGENVEPLRGLAQDVGMQFDVDEDYRYLGPDDDSSYWLSGPDYYSRQRLMQLIEYFYLMLDDISVNAETDLNLPGS